MSDLIDLDPFRRFRAVTRARIGIGRTGDAIPTKAVLDFQLAHARARDAVHGAVDFNQLAEALQPHPTFRMRSRAGDRMTYLSRPDLGRQLDLASVVDAPDGPFDVAFVIADGLSASAVEHHATAVVARCLDLLTSLSFAPVILAEQARVAFGDEAALVVGAKIVVVLIGERPGLTTPSSLGAYITYGPRKGRLDSERNCISNIHRDGLSHEAAAQKIAWIVKEAARLKLTGVDLKENASNDTLLISE